MPGIFSALLLFSTSLVMNNASGQTTYDDQRRAMIEKLVGEYSETEKYGAPPISSRTLAVLGRVPRHEFVPDSERNYAYANSPLPIGSGQTISQPYIVALMTDLAEVSKGDVVLEIGTGSGYQAAVLAEMADRVYTIEIVETLGRRAAETLEQLGYDNVTVKVGDGYQGWPDEAPFDAIVVTAAPEEIPAPLIEQLAVGGRLVVPVGAQDGVQILRVLVKQAEGPPRVRDVTAVRFVPFTRD